MSFSSTPHLLVPTDFRAAARRARQRAFQLAIREARVTLLHVLPEPRTVSPKTGFDSLELLHDALHLPARQAVYTPTLASHEQLSRRAMERLERELHPEWRETVDVNLALRSGKVVEQILRHVAEEQVDAIVLGLRRSCLPRLVPRLADRLLRSAPCEIILVSDARPPRADSLRAWLRRWWRRPQFRATGG